MTRKYCKSRKSRKSRKHRGGEDTTTTTGTNSMDTNSMDTLGGRRRRRRKHRGGDGASNWAQANFGSTSNQQYNNTFDNNGLGHQGNLIPTLPNAPAVVTGTNPQAGIVTQKGGQKGGYWAQVISSALVPFGLFASQNMYGNSIKRNENPYLNKSRRRRRSSRR